MKSPVRAGLLGVIALLVASIAQSSSAAPMRLASPASTTAAAHRCLVATGSGDPAFVRNFNPYVQGLPSTDFARGALYEPLWITAQTFKHRQTPWLATKLDWSKDAKTLTLTIRQGVKWSDGKPLTAGDVAYSLTAGRQDKSMDLISFTAPDSNIESIRRVGSSNKVQIRLKTRDSQFVGNILNRQVVVPRHVFSKVADMTKFTNPNPVGSGPFTRVTRFTTQSYTLDKNPNYWKPGRPRIQCVQRIAAASNDAALLQIVGGQADWTHNFVPNVEKAYIARDRKHYHAFYATASYPIALFFDTTKYPFSLIPFRKALSMAIDRNKVSKLGEYGYAPPTDAIGISHFFPEWVDSKVATEAKRLATYNPAAAKRLLTQAGFTYRGDELRDPQGNRVGFEVHVIGGWSDWVASLQIITKNLQEIGIDASVKIEPDWGSWFPNATSTKFVTLLWQTAGTASPYGFFYSLMHKNSYVASGLDGVTTGNYLHYQHAGATSLLNEWKSTLSLKKQVELAGKLQALWVEQLPAIPIFVGPRWSTYSTKYFGCFTTPKNYYADPIYNQFPDNVLQLTRICAAGA